VVYDDQIDIVVGSTPATGEAKRNALERLHLIDARGSTNLCGGWLCGAEQVASALTDGSLGRCLLLTDGLANQGETSPDALAGHARELRNHGIATSTFGVGADFDERLLQQMAQEGGGHFYFIEQAVQIPDLLTSELGDALEVVAREVALLAEVPDGVGVRPLQPLVTNEAGHLVRIELGDLVSAQELEVVLEVTFPAGQAGSQVPVRFSLTDREGALGAVAGELTWTVASEHDNELQPRDRVVDRAVATLWAAQARQAALDLNRDGRYEEARRLLEQAAAKIRAIAGHDRELLAIAHDLVAEVRAYMHHMDALSMKRAHFATYAVSNMRTVEGKTRKRS
jgi:Ca-activated chloride channel family protein